MKKPVWPCLLLSHYLAWDCFALLIVVVFCRAMIDWCCLRGVKLARDRVASVSDRKWMKLHNCSNGSFFFIYKPVEVSVAELCDGLIGGGEPE